MTTERPHIPAAAMVTSLEPAWRGMADRLFRPVDPVRWLVVAFTAWLSIVGENGMALRMRTPLEHPGDFARRLIPFLHAHAHLVLGLGALVLALTLAVTMALLWLRCHGRFLFLDNVVTRRAAVVQPWQATQTLGFSLFGWSLGFLAIACVFFLLAFAPLTALGLSALRTHAWTRAALGGMAVTVPLLLCWLVAVGYVGLFLHDFVVPIMYRDRVRAAEAWRRFGMLWSANAGTLLLYGLFRGVLTLVTSIVLVGLGVMSCCCLFLLLALPYLNAVVLLPLLVFLRLYALEFLRQAGPDFDVLAAPPPALPPPL